MTICDDPPGCTVNVDYVVASVRSNTSLTLTKAYTGTSGAGKTFIVKRQFTTLQAREDCIDGPPGVPCTYLPVASDSLVSDNRSEVGIAYDESVFTLSSPLVIDGRPDNLNTDATHTITLTADPGNRHHGLASGGVVLDVGGNNFPGIEIRDNFVTVEWLEIRSGGGGPSAHGIRVDGISASNRIVLRNNLIHGTTGAGNGIDLFRLQRAGLERRQQQQPGERHQRDSP
jgi:hypothetical protein